MADDDFVATSRRRPAPKTSPAPTAQPQMDDVRLMGLRVKQLKLKGDRLFSLRGKEVTDDIRKEQEQIAEMCVQYVTQVAVTSAAKYFENPSQRGISRDILNMALEICGCTEESAEVFLYLWKDEITRLKSQSIVVQQFVQLEKLDGNIDLAKDYSKKAIALEIERKEIETGKRANVRKKKKKKKKRRLVDTDEFDIADDLLADDDEEEDTGSQLAAIMNAIVTEEQSARPKILEDESFERSGLEGYIGDCLGAEHRNASSIALSREEEKKRLALQHQESLTRTSLQGEIEKRMKTVMAALHQRMADERSKREQLQDAIVNEENTRRLTISASESDERGLLWAKQKSGERYFQDTELFLYSLRNNDIRKVTEILRRKNFDVTGVDPEGFGCLHYAVRWGQADLVRELVELKADVNQVNTFDKSMRRRQRPLHLAAAGCEDSLEIMTILIAGSAELDAEDGDGNTPLHYACMGRNISGAVLLISSGAQIHHLNALRLTPLHCAAINGLGTVVRAMVERRADCNAQDCMGNTALLLACAFCVPHVAHILIAFGANVNTCNQDYHYPLNVAIANDLNDVAVAMLKCGARVDICDKNRNTPLHYACSRKLGTVSRALLQCDNVDVNAANKWFVCPVHYAASNGMTDILRIMIVQKQVALERAIDINNNTALHYAALNDDPDDGADLILKWWVGALYFRNNDNKTPWDYMQISAQPGQ